MYISKEFLNTEYGVVAFQNYTVVYPIMGKYGGGEATGNISTINWN